MSKPVIKVGDRFRWRIPGSVWTYNVCTRIEQGKVYDDTKSPGVNYNGFTAASPVTAASPEDRFPLTQVEILFSPTQEDPSVLRPAHYTSGPIECLDAIRSSLTPEEFDGFCKGQVIKYTWRERHKGGEEDRKKALFYATLLTGKDPRENHGG